MDTPVGFEPYRDLVAEALEQRKPWVIGRIREMTISIYVECVSTYDVREAMAALELALGVMSTMPIPYDINQRMDPDYMERYARAKKAFIAAWLKVQDEKEMAN